MSANGWPKILLFTADAVQFQFNTQLELVNWVNRESQRWDQIIPRQSWPAQLNANVQLLQAVLANVSQAALDNLVDKYRPVDGLLGKYVSRIAIPALRGVTFAEISQPGSSGQGSDLQTQGRTLAALYQAIGGKLLALEQAESTVSGIQQVVQQVQQLRDSDTAVTARYEGLVSSVEADWKNRIEGYEAKVALKAPRTYWTARAVEHATLSTSCRTDWERWVFGVVALIIVAMIANIYFELPDDIGPAIVAGVERAVVFATLLGMAVWFLRQKLRRLHMHEHFAEDAAERATMIETYAALRGAGLQDADLSPILAALYRSATGGQSEDHGPSLPFEIIGRAIGEAAARRG